MGTNETLEFKMIPQQERYYNEDSAYGVYTFITKYDIPEYVEYKNVFDSEKTEEEMFLKQGSLCGKMQKLYLGTEYIVKANLEFSKKYSSWQYSPINITPIIPKTQDQQKAFLEAIVTPRQASILLDVYPNIVDDVINGNDKDIDLTKTNGIKDYTWNIIRDRILDNYIISDILAMLQPIGVTYNMIKKLISNFTNCALLKQALLENPYILTKIHGLGFKTVDGLALKLTPDLRESHQTVMAYHDYMYMN